MNIGYARVSTTEQNLDRQIDALTGAGVDRRNIYQEKITGTKRDRPELNRMLNELQAGDTVIIPDLTRISRSTRDLLEIVDKISKKGANIRSLKKSLDRRRHTPRVRRRNNTYGIILPYGRRRLERLSYAYDAAISLSPSDMPRHRKRIARC